MLKKAYLLEKIGADTAEKERNLANILTKICNANPSGTPAAGRRPRTISERSAACGILPAPLREVVRGLRAVRSIGQTLQGSFSAVSKPNFVSKYAFESSRRDLHNALLCTALKSHFFVKNCWHFGKKLRKFSEILLIFNLAEFCKI